MSTLNTLSTEDFPFIAPYVQELLNLDDEQLGQYCQALGVSQKRDERTGKPVFYHRDVELLKRAVELTQSGESIQAIASRLNNQPANENAPAYRNGPSTFQPRHVNDLGGGGISQPTALSAPTYQAKQGAANLSPGGSRESVAVREGLAAMIETVSQVKEGILKDLSRMLDDKLSGLDEVVVQLIRAQSENESLKKRLEELQEANNALKQEVASFKPVQFGFYKKSRF